jgi:peptidoglycan hydrolase-like protein with peptidoglycan-binding domain
MPQTVSFGSQGPDVKTLQTKLNQIPPSQLPPLVADGIFGQKTLARVKEFQAKNSLVADGIVGPKTWDKLLASKQIIPAHNEFLCGNADKENLSGAALVQQQFNAAKVQAPKPKIKFGVRSSSIGAPAGATAFSLAESGPFRFLTETQKNTAKTVYGNSLDFSRIFISNKSGLGGRAFTVAFKDSNEVVQIINCGKFDPSDRLLIHELAHVWQSQHHSDPFQFMKSAVDCQAGALTVNAAEVFSDPDVLLHSEHPVNFPFSAYAYLPGLSLASYGAEQMAQACHKGEAAVRAHMKGVAMNALDPDNVKAMKLTAFADRRMTGIVI